MMLLTRVYSLIKVLITLAMQNALRSMALSVFSGVP